MSEAEPVEERWVFGGLRLLKGKRVHAWLVPGDPDDAERLFKAKSTHVIGAVYLVRVIRENGSIFRVGESAVFTGDMGVSEEERRRLTAADRAASTRYAEERRERIAKNDDALADLIAPLQKIATEMRTHHERAAFISYVTAELWRRL
jgi:hypothetical protein